MVLPGEVTALVGGTEDVSRFQGSGIIISGVKYMYPATVNSMIVGRAKSTPVVLQLTNKSLVIAILKDGATPNNVKQVPFIANDLKSKGF